MKISRYTPIEEFIRGMWINPLEFKSEDECMVTEVKESESSYYVDVDLPGVAKEDIDVNINGRRLSITAERKEWKEEESGKLIKTEKRYGKFYRSFDMEHDIDDLTADAAFVDGVLHLALPKKNGLPLKSLPIR